MDIVHVANIKATKGDVTWNDSQQQLLTQHSIAMLEQCCNYSKQSATMLQCCIELIHSLLRIVSCNITLKPLAPLKIMHRKFAGVIACSSLTSNMNYIVNNSLTSKILPRGGAHTPLTLVHACFPRWYHVYTKIIFFASTQRFYWHHIYGT